MNVSTKKHLKEISGVLIFSFIISVLVIFIGLIIIDKTLGIKNLKYYHWWDIFGVFLVIFTATFIYSRLYFDTSYQSKLNSLDSFSKFICNSQPIYIPILGIIAIITIKYIPLHLFVIFLIFVSFCIFDYIILQHFYKLISSSTEKEIATHYYSYFSEWLKHIDLPTSTVYLVLIFYINLQILFSYSDDFPNNIELIHIFVAGAIAFHLILSSIIFFIDSYEFITRKED